jgi:ankyrin repeat protein
LSLLLQEGDVDINICNSFGETPLLLASQAGCLLIVELFIDTRAKYVPNNNEKISILISQEINKKCLH